MKSNRMQSTSRRLTVLILAFAMMPVLLPPVSAATTTGLTAGLINPEQTAHEASSAIPAFGFGMTADTAEALDYVTVYVGGWGFNPGDTGDLAPLNVSSSISGVGLYRDTGPTDDKLDAGDLPVTFDAIVWSGNYVLLNLTGHNEAVMATVQGNFSWILVVRISNSTTLGADDEIDVAIFTNSIAATSAGGYAYQPSSDVYANTLYIDPIHMGNFGSQSYIGPMGVEVDEVAFAGIALNDGGKNTNYGINDFLTGMSLQLYEDGGVITSSDFAPITVNSATSGLGFYRDNGPDDDVWDSGDTAINFATISPAVFPLGGVRFDMTFSPSVAIPDFTDGSYDFFFVVRSGTIVSDDYFWFELPQGSVMMNGLLGADAGHRGAMDSSSGGTGNLGGDDTPPQISSAYWGETSPYLALDQDTLYFNHQMPARQNATVYGASCDVHSGVKNVTYSAEANLAGSPPRQNLSASPCWAGSTSFQSNYGFDASSSDGDGMIDFVVLDQVGNRASAWEQGYELTYKHEEQSLIIRPSPGWYSANNPLFIDNDGVLWFSDKIYGSSNAWLEVVAVSLYGGGVKNVSASRETGFDGPSNPFDTYGPGNTQVTFDTYYGFFGNSSTDGAVTVTALDHSSNTVTRDLMVRRDVTPPVITILAPMPQDVIRGNLIIWANVTDVGSGVDWVEMGVDPDNGSWDMIFDGTNWYVEIPSNTFTDGPHSFIVWAGDNVNNERAATVNVVFGNGVLDSVPPSVALVSPVGGAFLSGTTTVEIKAMDNAGVGSVWVQRGATVPVAATYNAATDTWEYSWDTTQTPDGQVMLTAIARDTFGREATASASVTVGNALPDLSISGPAPGQEIAGTYTVRVFANDPDTMSVKLDVAGRTVDMAYNPSTGYYEYTFDTRTLADGAHTMKATLTNGAGRTATTQDVSFTVKNGDAVRSLREASLPLLLIFAVLAFIVLLFLAMNGTFRRWMAPESTSSMSSSTTTTRAEGEPTKTSSTSSTTTSQMEPPKRM